MKTSIQILGLQFLNTSVDEAIEELLRGGVLMAPSGPGLGCDLPADPSYRNALIDSDILIADSGLMALIWNTFRANKIKRVSGLNLTQTLLSNTRVCESNSFFWVMPTQQESDQNLKWIFENTSIQKNNCSQYIAPMYPPNTELEDAVLLEELERTQPSIIIVAIGGGIQEKLGAYLRKNLSYSPSILCIGAAIAFLTGNQANIPNWADRLYLGWFMRIMQNPKKFIPRYWKAFRLIPILLLNWERLPNSDS